MLFLETIYPCSLLLRLPLYQRRYKITSPGSEPPSSAASEQSLGPIHCNHLHYWCRALPGFLPRLQANSSPWHYHTVCSPPQPVPELQDYTGLRTSYLLPPPLPGIQEPCFKEPDVEASHQGCPTPPGSHPPQAHTTAAHTGHAGPHAAEAEERSTG